MTEVEILICELSRVEVMQLPEGTQVLQYDSLFNDYSIKKARKDFFPANLRFNFFVFDLPKKENSE